MKPKLNINGDEAIINECVWCGKEKPIYAPNFVDPYVSELYPEDIDNATAGDWCEKCWDDRKDEI